MKLSRTKTSLYGNLQSVKMRRRHGLFTVEGRKAVSDMSRHYVLEALLTTETDATEQLNITSADKIYELTASEMKNISSFSTPSDVMGIFRIPQKTDDDNIDDDKLYLLLDGVRDPGNLGTIIRTCHWFGIYDIYASFDSVDCYNPKTVQATMGSLGSVRVHYCNLQDLLNSHPSMPVYGTLLEGDNIFESKLTQYGFIVMGNEGTGISSSIRARLTHGLNIPPATTNHGESLNVAIATAIVLAQFIK